LDNISNSGEALGETAEPLEVVPGALVHTSTYIPQYNVNKIVTYVLNQELLSSNERLSAQNQSLGATLAEMDASIEALEGESHELRYGNRRLMEEVQKLKEANQKLEGANRDMSFKVQTIKMDAAEAMEELHEQLHEAKKEAKAAKAKGCPTCKGAL